MPNERPHKSRSDSYPEYRKGNYIPGIHNQSWAPDEVGYFTKKFDFNIGTNLQDVPPGGVGEFQDFAGRTLQYNNQTTQQTFLGEYLSFHKFRAAWVFSERCERHFQYILKTQWSGGIAIAERRNMSGSNGGSLVIVRDPLGLFPSQGAGDRGYMVYTIEDQFIAIQAPCESAGAAPPEPAANRGCCITYMNDTQTESRAEPNQTAAECAALDIGYGVLYLGDGTECG